MRPLITELKAHGQVLFVVDQPATIGALPVAVARDEGVLVAYLPGLTMRRIADLHEGEAKTDARDAAIIAEAARSMPHTLRTLRLADEPLAELTMLCGSDDDLAGYAGLAPVTRRSGSSIRGEPPSRRGNKVLKRAPFLSAFAASRDPVSRND